MLTIVKSNVEEMEKLLKKWEASPLFERTHSKTYTSSELKDAFRTSISTRHKEIQDDGKQIVKFLSNSNRTLKVLDLKDCTFRNGVLRLARQCGLGKHMLILYLTSLCLVSQPLLWCR